MCAFKFLRCIFDVALNARANLRLICLGGLGKIGRTLSFAQLASNSSRGKRCVFIYIFHEKKNYFSPLYLPFNRFEDQILYILMCPVNSCSFDFNSCSIDQSLYSLLVLLVML